MTVEIGGWQYGIVRWASGEDGVCSSLRGRLEFWTIFMSFCLFDSVDLMLSLQYDDVL